MPFQRWKFDDPVTAESYVFEISANAGGSPTFNKTVSEKNTAGPGGATLIFEGQDQVQSFEFSGLVLTQAHYEAMVAWFNKRYTVMITDDINREFFIYITSFEPKRMTAVNRPWKHQYTCKAVVVSYA